MVVAAILVFIGNAAYGGSRDFGSASLLAFFGLILSIIGFFIVNALTLGYHHHITDLVMIYYYWDKMEFYRHPKKPTHFSISHRWFFEITIALFVVLLLVYLPQAEKSLPHFYENPRWLIVTFIGIFIFIEGLYQCEWEKYTSECSRFKKALQSDLDREYRKGDAWEEWFKDPRKSMGKVAVTPQKDTMKPEEIRKQIIEDAVYRHILPKAKKECALCELSHVVLRKFNEIYDDIIFMLCIQDK